VKPKEPEYKTETIQQPQKKIPVSNPTTFYNDQIPTRDFEPKTDKVY
jgi:hypothetical protein